AIARDKRDEVARRKTATPRSSLERACAPLAPPRDFAGALRPLPGDVALIAEVKKASPSRGTLVPPGPWDPIGLARIYADNGAAATRVGINNRELRTFETRLETTLALLPAIPPGVTVVSESGFASADDVRRVVAAGAHAVLVGEGLVRAEDTAGKVRELALR